MLDKVVAGLPKLAVNQDDVYRQAMRTPLFGSPPYGGKLVQELLARFPTEQSERVMAAVRAGVVSGQTNGDIIKAVIGTRAMNYQDGIAQATRKSAEMLVRTARNHVSNLAMADAYEKLGVAEVIDVATLDGRTSKYCASIDGRHHRVGTSHPRPPYHPNCRTMQAPALDGAMVGMRPYVRALKVRGRDGRRTFRSIGKMTARQREDAELKAGQVATKTNYGQWFANQDAAYQREWLGAKRYRLYKEGGYTIDRFVDPRTARQYSLAELRARDEETFRQIFGG